jgi:hypothetical protein
MATPTNALGKVRGGVLALGICASVAAGSLGAIGRAEARVPDGDRASYSAMICGMIQDTWDEARHDRDSATTATARAQASERMKASVDAWYANDCDKYYGRIARFELPGQQIKNIGEGVGGAGVLTPLRTTAVPAGGVQVLQSAN